ncbi:MAG: hypothetical protein QM523_10645, partial [Candidatus Pacebacteria bacterium]|nr:hypothetical protein [Candidatus Paceibacterota bacterium]
GTGTYQNGSGAGFRLNTTSQNLDITAAAIGNRADGVAIFSVGGSTLSVHGGLTISRTISGNDNTWSTGSILGDGDLDLTADPWTWVGNSSGKKYYFYSGTKPNTAAPTDGVWVPISALSANLLGTRTASNYDPNSKTAGFSASSGDGIQWYEQTGGLTTITKSFYLSAEREVHFWGVTTNTAINTGNSISHDGTTAVSFNPSSIVFDGINSFTAGLTLNTSGAISQSSGSTLAVSTANLVMTAGAEISLNRSGNDLGSLGAITANGAVDIHNGSAASVKSLTLKGNINSKSGAATGTTISITTNNGTLSIGDVITIEGGVVTLGLGTGTYASNGRKLTLIGQNLTLNAALVTGATNGTVLFDLKGSAAATGMMDGTAFVTAVAVPDGWSNSYGSISIDPTTNTVNYYVTNSSSSDKNGITDSNGVWLDATDFANATPFVRVSGAFKISQDQGGVYLDGAVYKWGGKGYITVAGTQGTPVGMVAGRPVTFVNLGTAATAYSAGFGKLNSPSAISFKGNNYISGGLTLSVAAAIDLASAGSLKVTGGDLTLTTTGSGNGINLLGRVELDASNRIILSSAGVITVTNGSNSISKLGAITANGQIAITSSNSVSVTENITSTTGVTKQSITITAAGMSLAGNITTSGGALNLELGNNGLVMNSHVLETSNNDLYLTASGVTGFTAGAVILRLGSTGKLKKATNLVPQQTGGVTRYYAYVGEGGNGYGDFISDANPNNSDFSWSFYSGERKSSHRNSDTVVWLPVAVLTYDSFGYRAVKFGAKSSGLEENVVSGAVVAGDYVWFNGSTAVKEAVTKLDMTNRDLSFVNVTTTDAVKVSDSASIQFVGVNSFNTLNLTSQGRVMQARNSRVTVTGLMTLGHVEALWLTNPLNQFSSITGSTGGGSVSITTNGDRVLNISDLKTGGGSVVMVASNGGISGSNLLTGGVHFRAAGSVDLSGVMASTSGTGSSVSIDNKTAGWVVGNVTSDTAVNLKGSGIILTGTVTSRGSSVEIAAPVKVVGEREIIAQSSLDVNRIDAMAGVKDTLKLYAGTAGVINLTANIGEVTKLGWVEFYARDLNRVPTITVNMMTLPPLPSDSRKLRVQ